MRNIDYEVDATKEVLEIATSYELTVSELMHLKKTYSDIDELVNASYMFGFAQGSKCSKGGESNGKE